MISRLSGNLVSKHPPLLVIDVNGVGYEDSAADYQNLIGTNSHYYQQGHNGCQPDCFLVIFSHK